MEEDESCIRWFFRNKWVRLIIYSYTCLTTSCLYYGWQQYSEMLYKGGAYSWLCPDGWDYETDGPCDDQDIAVTRLYSIGCAAEYSMALVAGYMLDTIGPCYTGLIGESVYMIGILLLMFSSQSFQAYIPAILLTAACVNITAFPSLILGDIFPRNSSMFQAIVIASQTGCTLMAPLMLGFWNMGSDSVTFKEVWGLYLAVVWLPVIILYGLALPTKKGFALELAEVKLLEGDGITRKELRSSMSSSLARSVVKDLAKDELIGGSDGNMTHSKKSGVMTSSSSSQSLSVSTVIDLNGDHDVGGHDHDVSGVSTLTPKSDWHSFWKQLGTTDWILCAVYYCLQILQYNYYPSVVRDAVSDDISNYVGWFMPTQIIWGILGGLMMDWAGTTVFMYILLAGIAITYGLVMIRNVALEYIVSTLFVIFQANIFTTKYTFVSEMFDKPHYGKLVGFLGLLGGLASLCNMPVTAKSNYAVIFYSYLAIDAPLIIVVSYLFYRQVKQGKCYRTQPLENSPWTMNKANAQIIAAHIERDEKNQRQPYHHDDDPLIV